MGNYLPMIIIILGIIEIDLISSLHPYLILCSVVSITCTG